MPPRKKVIVDSNDKLSTEFSTPSPASRTKKVADRVAEQAEGNPRENGYYLDLGAVAQRAWEIWQQKGCPEGRDVENWLEAERELARKSSH